MYSARWTWLLSNYRSQHSRVQRQIEEAYHTRAQSVDDDVTLYNIMMELGVKLERVDPCPPPPITQDGAEQYDDVMAAEALMQP